MSRYIDADAFLKEYCEPYPHVYKAMSRAMADAPSIDIPTWIPCSERLPSESGRYLCTYAEIQRGEYISCIDFGSFINGEWYTSGVIAWMPLPDSYGEREGE